MQAFHAVAAGSSFTEAAQRMNLTQSAVSMLVRQMEQELDLVLFDRVHRSARLTETGARLLPTVARILGDVGNVVDAAWRCRRCWRVRGCRPCWPRLPSNTLPSSWTFRM